MNRGMVELIQPDQAGLVYGLAALFTYSDTDEVETLADRAIVLSRGHIAGELTGAEITQSALLTLVHNHIPEATTEANRSRTQ